MIGGRRDHVRGGLLGWKDCLLTNRKDFVVRNWTNGRACRDLVCRIEFRPVRAFGLVYATSANGFHFRKRATSCGQMVEWDTSQGPVASYVGSDAEAVIVHCCVVAVVALQSVVVVEFGCCCYQLLHQHHVVLHVVVDAVVAVVPNGSLGCC